MGQQNRIFCSMIGKEEPVLRNIQNLDLRNSAHQEDILTRHLSKEQLNRLLRRIGRELELESSPEMAIVLKCMRKQLKSKYSICLSNQVIDKFMMTKASMMAECASGYHNIDKEVKQTGMDINKKKHYFNKEAALKKKEEKSEGERRKKRNVLTESMHYLKDHCNLDSAFIHEKLGILQEFISEEEMEKVQKMLTKKVEAIDAEKYGSHTAKIKNYTVYDFVLQKVFALIQEDSKNIIIRQKYQAIYKKMKEEMVSIITNQEEVMRLVKNIKMPSVRTTAKPKVQQKQGPKRNFYQLDKDRQDITCQIEDTIETARKAIKEALLKRGRPDYAYQMELSLGNRTAPCFFSKKRF